MPKCCFLLLALMPVSALCQMTTQTVHTECPIEATQLLPRVYAFRIYTADGTGWRPVSKMALDLRVRNKGNRRIAVMSIEVKATHGRISGWSDILLDRFDKVTLNIDPGAETQIIALPASGGPLMDLYNGTDSVSVDVTQLRYGDGEIVDLAACNLGYATIPPPFKPVRPTSASPIYPIGGEISPPRVLEGHLMDEQNNWRGATMSVLLSLVVEVDGSPQDIKVVGGTLGPELDQKAIETLRKWNFAPAMKGDQPVATRVTVQFKLGR